MVKLSHAGKLGTGESQEKMDKEVMLQWQRKKQREG